MKYKDGPVRKYHNNLPKIQMITKQAAAWKLSTDYSTRYKKKASTMQQKRNCDNEEQQQEQQQRRME